MKKQLLTLLTWHLGLAAAMAQPVITQQPQDHTAIAGATVTFSVLATGTPPLSYQWVFNTLGNRLPGATNDTLILPNVQASNAGNYRVVITNEAGSVQSGSARLTVQSHPGIVIQPIGQAAFGGDNVSIGVTASGSAPLSYQWYFDGQSLVGATRSNLTFTSIQSSNAGNYSVVVGNSLGSVTSIIAVVQIVRRDVIGEWNDALITVIRSSSQDFYELNRAIAMMHVAQFEAVNAVVGRYTSYAVNLAAPLASPEAAAAQAAFTVLSNTMSSSLTTWNYQLTKSLASIPNGPAKVDGIALGHFVANEIIKLRDSDGTFLSIPEPSPSLAPGVWRPTPPSFFAGGRASWRYTTPFTARSSSQFRSAPPPALDSARYAQDFNEIKNLGSAGSTSRTAEQSRIAQFHYNELPYFIAASTARALWAKRPLDLADSARLHALLFMICPDHITVCWESKYHYYFWRPITAIRLADTDGNPNTAQDATWNSFLVTPNSMDYPSGHATGVSSCNEILADVFGDDTPFTISSPALPGNFRSYARLSELTQEGQDARVYAGIHYRFPTEAGALLGRQLAQHALRNLMVRVPEVASGAFAGTNAFRITLRSSGPVSYVVETSSDLISWTPWQTNQYGVLQLTDDTAGGTGQRFYRAVQP